VRGKMATFVKHWGAGAVVRFDELPNEPKVVPIARVEPAGESRDSNSRPH
jgi:hypothetical protein